MSMLEVASQDVSKTPWDPMSEATSVDVEVGDLIFPWGVDIALVEVKEICVLYIVL